jgi:hypothetical protein
MTTPIHASDAERLHGERRKVLRPVDGDRGKLSFEVNPNRDGYGAELVLWESRGKEVWGTPVQHLNNQADCEAVAKVLNDFVERRTLSPGPLLPTNDSLAELPTFQVTSGGTGIRLAGEAKDGGAWGLSVHRLNNSEEAEALSASLNKLVASKVLRVAGNPLAAANPERRFDSKDHLVSMLKMADRDPAILNILKAVASASRKVDPKNPEPHGAPLTALDGAGIYGKDIEGLYQICGRHPGKVVALLRATTLGLIDAPAMKAALKPVRILRAVGILRAGGLDVDGITKEVESTVPKFSASRAEPDTLTGPRAPNLQGLDRVIRESQSQSRDLGRSGK